MDDNANPAADSDGPDISNIEAETLRRKVLFWRRLAMFLVIMVGFVLLFVWQRGAGVAERCRSSLDKYADAVANEKLQSLSPELLHVRWSVLQIEGANFTPAHYEIFPDKWNTPGDPDQSVDIAQCKEAHVGLLNTGRNVLRKTADGFEVVWVPE